MLNSFLKEISKYKLLIGILLLLLCAVLEYFGYQSIKLFIPRSEGSLFLIGNLGFIFISFLILFYIGSLYLKPIDNLNKFVKHIAEKDFSSLVSALTELSHGNLTETVSIHSDFKEIKAADEIKNLAESINLISNKMQEASKEYNSATNKPCQRLCYVGADSYLEGRALKRERENCNSNRKLFCFRAGITTERIYECNQGKIFRDSYFRIC